MLLFCWKSTINCQNIKLLPGLIFFKYVIFLHHMLLFCKKAIKFKIFLLLSVDIFDKTPLISQKIITSHWQYKISADSIKNCSSLQTPTLIISSIWKRTWEAFLKKRVEFSENGRNFHACIFNFRKSHFFLIMNFVKSPFFWHWILWSVHFSVNEFCEEFIFLTLNFVKSPFF